MNMIEAIRESNGRWFRPISWRKSGIANVVTTGVIYTVPSARGGECGVTVYVDDLVGEWEIVEPISVLEERI